MDADQQRRLQEGQLVKNSPIHRGSTLREVLDLIPEAGDMFVFHGVDPSLECLPILGELSLGEAERECALRDVDRLIVELNIILNG